MGYRTLLVYLPNAATAARTVKAAALLARRFDAHLVGLYVAPAFKLYLATTAYYDAAGVAERLRRHKDRHAAEGAEIEALFDAIVSGEGISAEWRSATTGHSDPLPAILESSNAADLVVAPEPTPEEENDPADIAIADRLVVEGGRPVFLVPQGWADAPFGRDIAVAYDGGREATRAVFDAVPLLRQAEVVRVIWVDPGLPEDQDDSRAADTIAATLARWDISVEAVVAKTDDETAFDVIMARVRDLGSDMLVMGAYGHSRLAQRLFPGFTRRVISADLPIPILMAH